jgi:hypothetical protein
MRKINKVIRGNKAIKLTKSAIAYAVVTLMVKNDEVKEETFESEYVKMHTLDMKELIQMYEYQLMLRMATNGSII